MPHFTDKLPADPVPMKPRTRGVTKSILKKPSPNSILIKPHLAHKSGRDSDSTPNPVTVIHRRTKSTKAQPKRARAQKRVNFTLPHVSVEATSALEFKDPRTFAGLSIPKMFTFHNKSLQSNDDLLKRRKKEIPDPEFLTQKYKRSASGGESNQSESDYDRQKIVQKTAPEPLLSRLEVSDQQKTSVAPLAKIEQKKQEVSTKSLNSVLKAKPVNADEPKKVKQKENPWTRLRTATKKTLEHVHPKTPDRVSQVVEAPGIPTVPEPPSTPTAVNKVPDQENYTPLSSGPESPGIFSLYGNGESPQKSRDDQKTVDAPKSEPIHVPSTSDKGTRHVSDTEENSVVAEDPISRLDISGHELTHRNLDLLTSFLLANRQISELIMEDCSLNQEVTLALLGPCTHNP